MRCSWPSCAAPGDRVVSWLPEDFEHPLRVDLPTGPMRRPRYVGRDLSWAEWNVLADRDPAPT